MAANTQKIVIYKTRAGNVHAALETTTLTVIRNVSDTLTSIIESCPVSACLSAADQLYISRVNRQTWYVKRLSELKLRANYSLKPLEAGESNPNVTISWFQDTNILDTQLQLTWPIPVGIAVWFLTLDRTFWYLVATRMAESDTKDGDGDSEAPHLEFYKLPLGNIHDDCAICMGDSFNQQVSDQVRVRGMLDIVTFMNAAAFYLEDTAWNSDLLDREDMVRASKVFQWNMPQLMPVPVSKELLVRNMRRMSANLNWGPVLTDVCDKFYKG